MAAGAAWGGKKGQRQSRCSGLPAIGRPPPTGKLEPAARVLTPTAAYCTPTWNVTASGDWFTVSPTSGRAPTDTFTVRPITTALAAYPVGRYTGTLTVTAGSGVLNGIQRITVTVDVVEPRLGNLPPALTFTYFISETYLLPAAHSVEVRNAGSDDVLHWTAAKSGDWFTLSPSSGTTPQTLWMTPTTFVTTTLGEYTGRITITVTSPSGTANPVQSTALALRVIGARAWGSNLPCVLRH